MMGGAQKRISDDKVEEMFQHWCGSQNMSATARQYKVSRSAVNRIAKTNQWHSKYAKVKKKAQKKNEKKVIKRLLTNVETVDTIINRLTAMFATAGKMCNKCGRGGPDDNYDFKLNHLLEAIKLHHELISSDPSGGIDPDEITPEVQEALAILSPILTNKRTAEAMGNYLVENYLMEEELKKNVTAA